MRFSSIVRCCLSASLVLALAGCGGGGSSDSSTDPTDPVDPTDPPDSGTVQYFLERIFEASSDLWTFTTSSAGDEGAAVVVEKDAFDNPTRIDGFAHGDYPEDRWGKVVFASNTGQPQYYLTSDNRLLTFTGYSGDEVDLSYYVPLVASNVSAQEAVIPRSLDDLLEDYQLVSRETVPVDGNTLTETGDNIVNFNWETWSSAKSLWITVCDGGSAAVDEGLTAIDDMVTAVCDSKLVAYFADADDPAEVSTTRIESDELDTASASVACRTEEYVACFEPMTEIALDSTP